MKSLGLKSSGCDSPASLIAFRGNEGESGMIIYSVLLSSCVIQLASIRGPGSACTIVGDTVL